MEELIELVKNWIKRANNDIKTAKDELNTETPATDTICFHAQQCVEKYLKAYLVFHQKYFKKIHNISKLIELCKETDPDFEKLSFFGADKLTSYAIEIRYADEESYFPSVEEAKEAINIAEKVKEFILGNLKQKGFKE